MITFANDYFREWCVFARGIVLENVVNENFSTTGSLKDCVQ